MCLDEYYVETIVRQRRDDAEAWAARQTLLRSVDTPWRVSLGRTLVRLGERLADHTPRRTQPSLS